MPEAVRRPVGAPTDWPEFPAVTPLVTDHPLPDGQWPALALSRQMVTPHVLNPDRSDVISAWLIQPGAPGPVAVAYRHCFNRSHPHGWQCSVYVFSVPVAGAAYARTRMSFSCIGHGIARTPEEARANALRHVTEQHQDAAVPYAARVLQASRLYR
ncbi:hypothetical protein ACIBBE_24560 [Streptomyces sp. NPDC051644]|uniref:hypothetical protein n=1 Tax=Streptomyces sp. NPDC051644 TaxID=3365666 RepID=UPI00379DA9DC